MSERGQRIKKLSIRHEAIMEWLIANPTAKMGECALAFGVSAPWLSSIIHSQAFQGRYQELIGENIDTRVLPLREQLTGVASRAVERLGSAVEVSSDPDFLLAVADKTLHRLGYAPSRGPEAGKGSVNNTQINVFGSVSKEDLERARARRSALYEAQEEAGEVQNAPAALPAPA